MRVNGHNATSFWPFRVLAVLLAVLCASAAAADLAYIGTTYPIRKGDSESDDVITPYPRLSQSVCFMRGSSLAIVPIDPSPEEEQWRVISAKLTSNVTQQVIWQINQESDLMLITESYDLPNLPDMVEWATLEVVYVVQQGSSGGGGDSLMSSPSSQAGEVFIVYGQPQSPQSVPFVRLLRLACRYAHGESTEAGIAEALTRAIYDEGEYDPSYAITWTTGFSAETFKLRGYLVVATAIGPRGMCNDYADFLACTMGGMGLVSDVKRSYSYADAYTGPLGNVSGWGFDTPLLLGSGASAAQVFEFIYHQFVQLGSKVYDAAIKVSNGVSYQYVVDMGSSDYKAAVVDLFRYWVNTVEINNPSGDPWGPITITISATATG
jgi:hypothetical protein